MMPEFEKRWAKFGLDDEQLQALQEFLCVQPDSGDIIEETGGLRKIRWSLPGKGKRGGVRVLYVDFATSEKTYLMTAFKKSQKISLSSEEKTMIKQRIKALKHEVRRKQS